MDHRPAEFVRFVDPAESIADLMEDAKADTWTKGREHALIVAVGPEGERLLIVRGGRDGIVFDIAPDGGIGLLVHGVAWQVARLAWHTHPRVTGPSDHDRELLARLGQATSVVFEINGPAEGTVFRRR